jgi:hypothetical protein
MAPLKAAPQRCFLSLVGSAPRRHEIAVFSAPSRAYVSHSILLQVIFAYNIVRAIDYLSHLD